MRFWRTILSTLCLVAVATAASAQTRSVVTQGSSTGTGITHITIEDFGKPGQLGPLGSGLRLQTVYEIDVNIAAGLNCAQITQLIYNQLVASLPNTFTIMIAPTNPCILYISKGSGGSSSWGIAITITAPGTHTTVEEGAVPVQERPWSWIKSHRWNVYN